MGLSKLLAFLLAPAYMLTIAILAPLKINYVLEPSFLLPVTNTLFAGLLPIVVAYIGARVYLVTGSSSVMFMGCGMFAFGLAAISAGWLIGRSSGPNINVTIYNSGALVSASFHILGAFLFLKGPTGPAEPKRGKLKALAAYGVVLGLVALLSLLAVHEVFPPFFIQGIGPTVLRQEILGIAIILYILSSVFFMYQYLNWKFDFFYWYSLALALLAIGLFAFLVQSAVGSPIGWVGRSANYFGGIFSLIAVVSAGRVARYKSLSLEESMSIFFSDAESSYKSLVEASSDAVVSFDQEGRIIGWNTSAGNMFGHTRKEAIGSSFFDLIIHEKYVAVLKKQIESVIARSDGSSLGSPIEIQGKRCDGSQFPVEVSVSVRELPTGRAITYNIRDITRRKQDEDSIRRLNETLELRVAQRTDELRESEDRLRSLVDHLPQRILLKDRNSVYLFCNENYASDLGITPEQIVGKDDFAFHPPELAQAYRTDDLACMTTGMVKDIEETAQFAGQQRWVHTIKLPYHDRQGRVIGVLWIFEDITEHKQSEEKNLRLAAIVDSSDDAIIGKTLDGTITSWNKGAEKIYGYKEHEVVGKPITILASHDREEEILGFLEEIKSGKSVKLPETVHRNKAGDDIPVSLTISPIIDEDGCVIGASTIVRDISDRVKAAQQRQTLQEQLIQAQKMEAVGTLAGGVAHDFNNLLQVVLGYSELMLERKHEGEHDYADLQKIYDAAKRGADLVKSLMTFSRKAETKFVPVDLNQEITSARDLLSRTIPKTININLNLKGNLESIKADTSQIGQVLMNLGVNARDAMPDGGTLTFETANVQLDEEYCSAYLEIKPGSYILLTISDTGQGMDKDALSHIFEPFFTTKEKGKGTGLGLAIVYGIVKQHGGHISCYSEPGVGTSFKIYLPAIQTKKELETPTFEKAIPSGTETILLVEDDESIRNLGAAILKKFGYKVITAGDGKEALEIYQVEKDRIDLIMLDLIMPIMDGRQCLAGVLRINPDAKIIIASGVSEAGSASGARVAGAKGFVQKPYDMRKLLTKIREILDAD